MKPMPTVPCVYCGTPTTYTGTQHCDPCHSATYAPIDTLRKIIAEHDRRAAHEPRTALTECPYCKKPAGSDGGIFHVGGCRGLDDIKMIRLQYDALVAGAVPPPGVITSASVDSIQEMFFRNFNAKVSRQECRLILEDALRPVLTKAGE